MSDNDFLIFLNKIEKTFPINSFKHDGAHIWPLVRLNVNTRRKYAANQEKHSGVLILIFIAISSYIVKNFFKFRSKKKQKTALSLKTNQILDEVKNLDSTDVLLICLEKEHFQKFDHKLYAPLIDSIKLLSGNELSFTKISLGWKADVAPYYKTFNLNLSPFTAEASIDSLRAPSTLKNLAKSIATITWLGILSLYIKFINSSYNFSISDILDLATKMQGQRVLFKELIKSTNAKAVLMTSYTGRIGVVSAAKQLNIPVFDIQHGGSYKDHPISANWYNIPAEGYDYLPTYFWCWSDKCAQTIVNHGGNPNSLPIAFTGGHPWFGACLYEAENKLLSDSQKSFLNTLDSENRKIILLALQYGPDAKLDDFVTELINETSQKWKWLVRLHPMGHDMKDELTKNLNDSTLINEIDVITGIPLPVLLSRINHVITGFSSLGIEAGYYGIKTTIFSPVGYKFFRNEIESGTFNFANDKVTLEKSIADSINTNNKKIVNNSVLPTGKPQILALKNLLKN